MPGEREVNATVTVIIYECECGGEMRKNGWPDRIAPVLYPHLCDSCGKEDLLSERYPNHKFNYKRSK